jgi:hypothetical protein
MSFLGSRNAVSIGVSPHLTLGGSNLLGRLSPSLILQFAGAQTMDPRITFTRASTATYYGTQTALAEQNLLLQSQALATTPWGGLRSTRTNNADTAPDGTATATRLTQQTGQTTSGAAFQTNTVAASATTSVFAKADGKNFLVIQTRSTGNLRTWFDLSTGTVGTTNVNHTASIVNAGSGWYRCIVTSSQIGDASTFYLADTDNSLVVTDSGSILLWGSQLEQRSAVTAYTPTTTQPITNYIPVLETAAINAPRFDYNPITQAALGLLIEEQRTNLRTYSEDFTNAVWTKSALSITANTVVAPDGTLTGDKLVEDTATSRHFVTTTVALTANTVYTLSVYMKAGERTTATFGNSSTANWVAGASIVVNLATGVITTGTGTIQSVGNGWYRVSITQTFGPANANGGMIIDLQTTAGYTGDGYSGIYIWGAQLEAGAFLTSYIQTVASQVTRSRDAASMTGTNFSSWYNATEGSAYTEAASLATAYNGTTVAFSDGTLNSRMIIRGMTTTSQSNSIGVDSGATQWALIFSSQTTATTKWALGYKVDDIAFVRNAATPLTDASALIPVVNQLRIGSDGDGAVTYNGHIRQIVYYPRRLTNSDLQTITA